MVFNAVVYAIQAVLWVLAGLAHSDGTLSLLRVVSSAFIAVVSISAAFGFLLYGGRLFLMLRRYDFEAGCPDLFNCCGSVCSHADPQVITHFGLASYWMKDVSSARDVIAVACNLYLLAARSMFCFGVMLLPQDPVNRFPIESRGRRKKLREVGCVTAICAICFTLRAVIVAWSAIDSEDADLVCLPPALWLSLSFPLLGGYSAATRM